MSAVFYWTGVVVFVLAAGAAVLAVVIAAALFWYSPFGPMLHWGAPELECEISFYSRAHIMAKKGGGSLSEEELRRQPRRVDHFFKVPWFAGISTRKGHFLLGILRLRRSP